MVMLGPVRSMRFLQEKPTPLAAAPLGKAVLALTFLCGLASAQSALTTIQDTLFKADGTRFSGTVTIRWNTFNAANIGTIVQQTKSVTVTNGNLQVALTPNAGAQPPANTYTVFYQSDGREQFTESWTVAASAQPVKVAAVRTGMITTSVTGAGTAGNQTPIVESAVIGLVADLNQRPIKGPGFGTGSVAVINSDGQIESAVGNLGECVLIDGTTSPCGGVTSSFYDAETPGGLVDGSNTTFTLANAPSGASLSLFRNGLYMKAGFDYMLAGSTVQFVAGAAPQPMDTLVASYRVDPSVGNIGALKAAGVTAGLAQILCSASGQSTSAAAWASLGSCQIPAFALKTGDRIEVQFNFVHTGTASGFDLQINWGATTILARHGVSEDAAVAGQAQASLSATGVQLNVQSWGTVLPFLPAIVSSPLQSGLKIDLRGQMSAAGTDTIALSNFTVLRYPAN